MVRPFRALCVLLVALASPAAAADCRGGSVLAVRLVGDRVRFDGTVTQPQVSHASFASAGLHLEIADVANGSVLYAVDVPGERFVTRGRITRYDGAGAFRGTILLKKAPEQGNTIRIVLRATKASLGGLGGVTGVRASMTAGSECVRTCVSSCTTASGGLRCDASERYVPFADEGFGALLHASKKTTNPLCGLAIDTSQACDFLIDERCILPFPSAYFLAPDASTPTGLRLNYGAQALPANVNNKHIDPTDWNTLDGFSPGPTILSLFPDTGFPVDLAASHVAPQTNFARSLDPDHPTVVMNAGTGERIVHFAEMDANTDDVTRKALIIRPGKRLDDGTRYLVAIRDLVDTQGTPIRPRLAFRALRDAAPTARVAAACGAACAAAIDARRATFADVFARLGANGVDPHDLVLAWDFTTASTQTLTGWIRSIRDQAFALGTPAFTVTTVRDNGGAGLNADIFREVEGTFKAPLFMNADAPATRIHLVNGVPAQNGFATVPFVAEIPRSAVNVGGTPVPGRPSLWGHGLLGDRFQVRGLNPFANANDFVMAAVDMQGMSSPDLIPAVLPLIQDSSKFHFIPERLHQGFLNHLLLGRLLVDPVNGFNSDPAFQFNGTPLIDTTEVYYSGGSQGGIFGVAIMSIAEDFKRGFLAVPGANYSTLLHRSIDFNQYLAISRGSYPDRLDEELVIALIQQLWDRAEPQGYMNHLVSGDLSTPPVPHKVLMHMSTCDSQVSNLATEIMVRSLGVPQVAPPLHHFFEIPEVAPPVDGYDGSALQEIDWGKCVSRCNVPGDDDPGAVCTTDADCPGAGDKPSRTRCDSGVPPLANLPPQFENGAHGAEGSASPSGPTLQQANEFLKPDGTVKQLCTGPCDPS